MNTPDISIDNSGTIALLVPETPAGREWIDQNLSVEPWQWQWMAGALAVEPRYAAEIAELIEDDGLIVAERTNQ